MHSSGEYADWVMRLVRECLPESLQIKILTCAPLTKAEAMKFANVIALVSEAKGLKDHSEMIGLLRRINEQSRKGARDRRKILWHVSGHDTRYEAEDGRSTNAVRAEMARRAAEELRRGVLKPIAIFKDLVEEYRGVSGAYTSASSLKRAAYRFLTS